MEAKLKQHIAGENSQPRKKYKDVADRLYTLVNGFNAHEEDDFDDVGDNAPLVLSSRHCPLHRVLINIF